MWMMMMATMDNISFENFWSSWHEYIWFPWIYACSFLELNWTFPQAQFTVYHKESHFASLSPIPYGLFTPTVSIIML